VWLGPWVGRTNSRAVTFFKGDGQTATNAEKSKRGGKERDEEEIKKRVVRVFIS
jgi:hypothetical protein